MNNPYQKFYYFLSAILIGILIGVNMLDKRNLIWNYNNSDNKLQKLSKFIDYIENDYIDSINVDSILDETILNITKNLDPHSVYIPQKINTRLEEETQGYYVGIGIEFIVYKDTLTVVRILENSPASKANIQIGDCVLIANNDTLYGKGVTTDDITNVLKGDYKQLETTIYRKIENKYLHPVLYSDKVFTTNVPVNYMINDTLGYIQITQFNSGTSNDFHKVLSELLDQGTKHLILDLRDNPGGILEEAIAIADEFLSEGQLIVSIKQRNYYRKKYKANSGGLFENRNISVLINENSASASEIVAGALQDNDIGKIIGRKSFGKGLIQQDRILPDGSRIRLTVGRYYTPTGRSIQKPYDNENTEKNIKHKDTADVFKTPKGKIVYGGGGITPDIYIPEKNIKELLLKKIVNLAISTVIIMDYYKNNTDSWNEIKQKNTEEIEVEKTLKSFYINQMKTHLDFDILSYKEYLDYYLKAELIGIILGKESKVKYLQKNDPSIKRVLEG